RPAILHHLSMNTGAANLRASCLARSLTAAARARSRRRSHVNDRLLLALKGSLNEYELDLLRQRSLSARYEKARRGELVVSAPVGFVKAGGRYEKDPDRRVQEAIGLVFDKVLELGSARQARSGSTSMISICR